jgi:tripartite-type tricarboxylate transporter receptor subunit TctC
MIAARQQKSTTPEDADSKGDPPMKHLVAGLALACTLLAGTSAHAQYPSKQITLVVPFAAGGSNDIVARAIGKKLGEAWGQTVVIDNRAGAGGVIGAEFVARSPADGYTLLLVSSTYTINPAVKSHMPFDTLKAFDPVAFIGSSPLLIASANKVPAKSLQELIALAKEKPGSINYASAGPGSINQIAAELFASAAGVKIVHVPYKGGSLAINDLVGGHVDLYVSSMPQILQIAKTGQVRPLAVTGLKRSPTLPDVPTADEVGLKGYEATVWWGIVAPTGTPADVVVKLNAQINKALGSDEMKRFLEGEGAEAGAMTPQAFRDLTEQEVKRWERVAKEANIRAD